MSLLPPLREDPGNMVQEVVWATTPARTAITVRANTLPPFLRRRLNRPHMEDRGQLTVDTQTNSEKGRSSAADTAQLPSPELGPPPTPPPKRVTTDGNFSSSHNGPSLTEGQASGSNVQVKSRTSAPAVMDARESIVVRGVLAQERRRDLSHRRMESPPRARKVGTSRVPDNVEDRINRLLRVVEHFPCRHHWVSGNEHTVCDGCYRGGSSLLVSVIFSLQLDLKTRTNHVAQDLLQLRNQYLHEMQDQSNLSLDIYPYFILVFRST